MHSATRYFFAACSFTDLRIKTRYFSRNFGMLEITVDMIIACTLEINATLGSLWRSNRIAKKRCLSPSLSLSRREIAVGQ